MRLVTLTRLGQVAGALLLAAGVSSCILRGDPQAMSWLFIAGAVLYGASRVAEWLARPVP